MKVLLEPGWAELIIKKSRFIAEIFPIENQVEAREILKNQKQKYADSSHVVHAFISGLSGEVSGLSDDGEPSGTAGRPVYDVLKGSGITNIMLTVTRYFGGTLLGTGGLVKAYSEAAKEVLAIAEAETYIPRISFSFSAPYEIYEPIKRSISHLPLTDSEETFLEKVCFKALLPLEYQNELLEIVKNISKDQVKVDFD